MAQPPSAIHTMRTAGVADGLDPMNALMLVAATFFASAVFAGVASTEGLPVIVGVLLPWLALIAAAAWWFAAARRERRVEARTRARAIEDARTVAVNLLLADEIATPAGLAAAAALVLSADPTREHAQALLDRSPDRDQLSGPSR